MNSKSRPCERGPQAAVQLRIAAKLARQRKGFECAAPARQLDFEAAHSLTIESRDRADLGVDIDIADLLLGLAVIARQRAFDEASAIEHIAAQRHLERSVLRAVSPQRRLVAFGRGESREIDADQLVVLIDLGGALDQCATAFDQHILKSRGLRLLHHVEGHTCGFTGELGPTRQDVVHFCGR